MRHAKALTLLVVPLFSLTGCASEPEAREAVGSSESSLVGENALQPNALQPNALQPNALQPNALQPNALQPNALAPGALSAIQAPGSAGDLSRMFLKYAVSCALDPSQSFSFTWTDSAGSAHHEVYPGDVGLAPEWASGSIDASGQQIVSACLAARTNWYGVTVMISMRAHVKPLLTKVKSDEVAAYPHIEGAFWGNIFAPTPYLRTCYNSSNVANSRSYQRDCAAGHVDTQGAIQSCGLIDIVGPCQDVCLVANPSGQFYPACNDPAGGNTNLVITTALP